MQGIGQGSTSTGLSNAVNVAASFPHQSQTKLYTAYLEVDTHEAENAPMPVDLVSPIDTSRMDAEPQRQPAALQVQSRQPSTTAGMAAVTNCCTSRHSVTEVSGVVFVFCTC